MIKLILYIILLLSFSLTSYGKDLKVIIATVQLDKTLKEDNDLRIMLLTTIRGYSFLDQVNLIKVDRKIKKLYKKKEKLDMEDAIKVSKELGLDVAIVLYNEKRLIAATNGAITNGAITNGAITNGAITNSIGTNKMFETTYFIQGINIETEETIYSNETTNVGEVNMFTRELINVVGINYSRNILGKIESPSNDIDLQFGINVIDDNDNKINLTNNSDIYVSDKLEFNFTVNEDGFITIVGFLNNDSMLLLNPNDFSKITNVVSNETYTIPSKDSIFEIIASGSKGVDEYFIIFTEEEPDFVGDTKYVNGTGFKNINKANIPEYSKLIRDELKKKKNWRIQKIKLNLNELFFIKEDEMVEGDVYEEYY